MTGMNWRKIAKFIEVDEIHIIDERGEIVSGTHPVIMAITLIPGSRCAFSPMLNDKGIENGAGGLSLITAENKLMQYSAVWETALVNLL